MDLSVADCLLAADALDEHAAFHETRVRLNPHGPWADDSRDRGAAARELAARFRSESTVVA
jgi:hypothetical protein